MKNGETSKGSLNKKISLKVLYYIIAGLGALILAALVLNTVRIFGSYKDLDEALDEYASAQADARELTLASDYLTAQVRGFALSPEMEFVDNYFEEANVTKRRDRAVEKIRSRISHDGEESIGYLERSLELSRELMKTEFYAFVLGLDAAGYDAGSMPEELRSVKLSEEDAALDRNGKLARARELVFGQDYEKVKNEIDENAAACTDKLMDTMRASGEKYSEVLKSRLMIEFSLMTAMLIVIVLYLVFTDSFVLKPIGSFIESVQGNKRFEYDGLREMSFLSSSYNEMLERTREDTSKLAYDAMHDALTDLYNRAGYEEIMQTHENDRMAFLILDIDKFKEFNDMYGHAVGDSVLKRVAAVLKKNFRSEDYICRIGGDEFAVIMVNADSSLKELVKGKLKRIADELREENDSVPGATLSVGVAFSDREDPQGSIFEDADKAL